MTRCLRSWEIGADAGRLDAGVKRRREPRGDSLVLRPRTRVRGTAEASERPQPLAPTPAALAKGELL